MKKTILVFAALAALVSCRSLKEEWQPVFTGKYVSDVVFTPVTEDYLKAQYGMESISTIASLKALYSGPRVLTGNVWIKGQVISSDQSGNIYNEIYLQDETGAIDLKLGKASLYNEYPLGQWVYVRCDGLTLGSYNGMPQLGWAADQTITNEYETSYINLQALIDEHVFRGALDAPVSPKQVTAGEIATSLNAGYNGELWGKLVTISGLRYKNEVFALFYPNPNMPHTSGNPENRVFLSDGGTWGINTWACTKAGYIGYLESGSWDSAQVGSGATRYGSILGTPYEYLSADVAETFGFDASSSYKEIMIKYASANYVSHYFSLGSTDVQIRTSGYAKFADVPLSDAVLSGQPVTVTGILTIYNGAAQFSLVDEPALSVIPQ